MTYLAVSFGGIGAATSSAIDVIGQAHGKARALPPPRNARAKKVPTRNNPSWHLLA